MSLADQSIECRYEITKDDYAVLNAALMHVPNRHTPFMFTRLALFLIFCGILVWAVKHITGDSWQELASGLGIGVLVGGIVVYVFRRPLIRFYGRLMARQYYASDLVEKEERVLTFSQEGLSIESPKFNGDSPWAAFTSIMRTEEHFLIWQNARQAHVVPFRALSSAQVTALWAFFETMPISKKVRLS